MVLLKLIQAENASHMWKIGEGVYFFHKFWVPLIQVHVPNINVVQDKVKVYIVCILWYKSPIGLLSSSIIILSIITSIQA